MREHRCFPVGIILAALIVTVALSFGTFAAIAQPLVWNPSCARATIFNHTACSATVTLRTIPAGSIPAVTVPPCSFVVVTVPNPTAIDAVITQASNVVLLATPPPGVSQNAVQCGPIIPFPAPPARWARGVVLDPPPVPGCCFDLFFYPNDCTIWLFPGTPPCTP